jgi:arsenite methyltransferase
VSGNIAVALPKRSTGRADYGIDAPGLVRTRALVTVAGGLVAVAGVLLDIWWLAWSAIGVFVTYAILTGRHLWYSKVDKLRERSRLLDRVGLMGDETVLDIGCGRGLLLVEAARRVPRGRAIGADIWSDEDQSKNVPDAPLRNARLEHVDDRVEVCTADARNLPFPDGEFDAVVSQFAVHNIRATVGRGQAIQEIDRVLKPGGRLVLVDLAHTEEYVAGLSAAGWTKVFRSSKRWRMFPPARYVDATKPHR